jgi:hypothetical protein
MKTLLLLIVFAVVSLGVLACGDASKGSGSTPNGPADAAARTASQRGLLSDGDADNPRDIDGDGQDGSEDSDDDSKTPESYTYHDHDDSAILGYGHPAGVADGRAVTAAVKRYYAAAAVHDGATACSLILLSIASSVPETYAQRAGPPYLRGGKTCQAVMTKLFRHLHSRLAGTIEVTGVRVNGDGAEALLGSTTMHASDVMLKREGGTWKFEALLGSTLP